MFNSELQYMQLDRRLRRQQQEEARKREAVAFAMGVLGCGVFVLALWAIVNVVGMAYPSLGGW
jgi:hypothetical protein